MTHLYLKNVLFLVFFAVMIFEGVGSSPSSKISTYEHLYQLGVDAYLENRWQDCVTFFEKALEDYSYNRILLVHCRNHCKRDNGDDLIKDDDLRFFESVIRKAACLLKCEPHINLQNRKSPPSRAAAENFEKRTPYNYLQLCYFKVNNIEKAASSAFTFLLQNPDHDVMKTNLQYYLNEPDISIDKIQSLETEDYQELFLEAAHMYTEKRYADVIELMEKALHEYLLAEEKCRLLCEDPTSDVAPTEIHVIIARLFISTLQCKEKCSGKLSNIYGQKHDCILSAAYHYLQFSYYQTGKIKEACEAVSSYLYLHPGDKVMTSNQEYYSKQKGVNPEWFKPREEAVQYQRRLSDELVLKQRIEKLFQADKISSDKMQFPTPPPGSSNLAHNNKMVKGSHVSRQQMSQTEIKDWLLSNNVNVYMEGSDLNGTTRAAFQGLATSKDCANMIKLADEGAVFGDGYNGKESPHTEFEMFEGITIARAATLSQRGLLSPDMVQLFLNVSEKARKVVEIYFNLESELYFAYTHLVCRTAFPDSPNMREDLSHPVHADNCMLTSDGDCLKKLPAYIWRDYSSIVYLNDDFEGGEFIFASDKKTVQASVQPACGVMVAFSAGKENLHGVKAVKKGRRCALAMWYTLDPLHKEHERDFSHDIVNGLVEKRKLLERSAGSPASKSYKERTLRRLMGKRDSVLPGDASENSRHDEL